MNKRAFAFRVESFQEILPCRRQRTTGVAR
jgi:hypothetical protein